MSEICSFLLDFRRFLRPFSSFFRQMMLCLQINCIYLQLQSERNARHIAQILLSNHHLTTRIIEQANLRWSYALSVDFSHSRLGACGEPDRRYGESALSSCHRVCATRGIKSITNLNYTIYELQWQKLTTNVYREVPIIIHNGIDFCVRHIPRRQGS